MKNNDLMDEDYGKKIENEQTPQELPWATIVIGGVLLACVLSVVVCLTLRLDKWLLR
jgi:hypothetical protein